MPDTLNRPIPFGDLRSDVPGAAILDPADQVADLEVAGALLTRVMHQGAEGAAGASVGAVSVAISVTGDLSGDGPIRFQTSVERRTRTLVFLKGEAWRGDRPIMVADSVFRIGTGD